MAQKSTKKSTKKAAASSPSRKASGGKSARRETEPKAKAKSSAGRGTPAKTAAKAAAPAGKDRNNVKVTAPVKKNANTTAAASAPAKKEKAVSTLSKADLQYFRNLLLEKRREILGDVGSMESEAFKGGSNLSNMPIHMADVGTDNFEQEFTLGLIESERQILREIQDALARTEDGTFGICQGTNKPIPRVRLEAVPWAKYTIEYSRMLEQGKISRDAAGASEDDSEEDED